MGRETSMANCRSGQAPPQCVEKTSSKLPLFVFISVCVYVCMLPLGSCLPYVQVPFVCFFFSKQKSQTVSPPTIHINGKLRTIMPYPNLHLHPTLKLPTSPLGPELLSFSSSSVPTFLFWSLWLLSHIFITFSFPTDDAI